MSLQQLNGLARICPGAMLVVLMIATAGCAGVKVNAVDNRDYLSLRRGDALTSGKLSVAARTSLQVAGVAEKDCSENPSACREQVPLNAGLGEEQRLSTLSEFYGYKRLRIRAIR